MFQREIICDRSSGIHNVSNLQCLLLHRLLSYGCVECITCTGDKNRHIAEILIKSEKLSEIMQSAKQRKQKKKLSQGFINIVLYHHPVTTFIYGMLILILSFSGGGIIYFLIQI